MRVFISFIFAIFSLSAQADSLKPLNKITSKSNFMNEDMVTVSYVYLRCGAAYSVMGGIGSEKMNMPKAKTDQLAEYSTDFLQAAVQLDELKESTSKAKDKLSKQELFKNALARQLRLIDLYWVDLKDNKDKTGDHFSGNFLSDVQFCSSLGK